MAYYVNKKYADADDGPDYKHLLGWCPILLTRAAAGFAPVRVPNRKQRPRCPECFYDGGPLTGAAPPAWLATTRRRERAEGAAAWTYDVYWLERKVSQPGMATNVSARLTSRWRATCRGRLVPHSIPWLYDLTADARTDEALLTLVGYESREAALAGERNLREKRLSKGWHVSSDR